MKSKTGNLFKGLLLFLSGAGFGILSRDGQIMEVVPGNDMAANSHGELSPKGDEQVTQVNQRHSVTPVNHNFHGNQNILCYLLVAPSTHKLSLHVKETWGKRCNKTIFFSTTSDRKLGTVDLGMEEGYKLLWEKSQRALNHLYHNYSDYDWYLKADHDTYIVMENLFQFLSDKSSKESIYYGLKYDWEVDQGYMSGGSGYVFSRKALVSIVERGLGLKNDGCPTHLREGPEDMYVGKCFETVGVKAGNSFDPKGLPRFFAHGPETLYFKPDENNLTLHWYWMFLEHRHPLGPGCCSDYIISFHYIKPRMMWAIEMLLYHTKVYKGTLEDQRYFAKTNNKNGSLNSKTF